MAFARRGDGLFRIAVKLLSDARFWFPESKGDVQMVLMTKIGRSSPRLVLESSESVNKMAKRRQTVTISKSMNNNAHHDDQPLEINFDKLLLRPSQSQGKRASALAAIYWLKGIHCHCLEAARLLTMAQPTSLMLYFLIG
ncbi:hypothetical protein N7535_007337 [Penicillium sp. DV-2018c]|nr:hypothetical protein N7461_003364 [Penicillium sp. DV-2018c]KAJ5565699.1 hypothetical protein N7535_007337 [Penicillium sp. DV-2018c]